MSDSSEREKGRTLWEPAYVRHERVSSALESLRKRCEEMDRKREQAAKREAYLRTVEKIRLQVEEWRQRPAERIEKLKERDRGREDETGLPTVHELVRSNLEKRARAKQEHLLREERREREERMRMEIERETERRKREWEEHNQRLWKEVESARHNFEKLKKERDRARDSAICSIKKHAVFSAIRNHERDRAEDRLLRVSVGPCVLCKANPERVCDCGQVDELETKGATLTLKNPPREIQPEDVPNWDRAGRSAWVRGDGVLVTITPFSFILELPGFGAVQKLNGKRPSFTDAISLLRFVDENLPLKEE